MFKKYKPAVLLSKHVLFLHFYPREYKLKHVIYLRPFRKPSDLDAHISEAYSKLIKPNCLSRFRPA